MAPVVKRMVCLANSRQPGGRCVAGIELLDSGYGGWIRPISNRKDQEIHPREYSYLGGGSPELLDVIDVPLLEPQPESHQQENWLFNPNRYWKKADRLAWSDLHNLAETAGPLWVNGHKTQFCLNNMIPVAETEGIVRSLRLIWVDSMTLTVFTDSNPWGPCRRRTLGAFAFHAENYRLWVTDPVIETRYSDVPSGKYRLGESFLTISLSKPFHDACYKLVAAIMERPAS